MGDEPEQSSNRVAEGSPGTALKSMLEAGLVEHEILHLVGLKKDIVSGKRSEATIEHRRLLFARYLHERGILHD